MRGVRFVDDDFLATVVGDIFAGSSSLCFTGAHMNACVHWCGWFALGWRLQALPGKHAVDMANTCWRCRRAACLHLVRASALVWSLEG